MLSEALANMLGSLADRAVAGVFRRFTEIASRAEPRQAAASSADGVTAAVERFCASRTGGSVVRMLVLLAAKGGLRNYPEPTDGGNEEQETRVHADSGRIKNKSWGLSRAEAKRFKEDQERARQERMAIEQEKEVERKQRAEILDSLRQAFEAEIIKRLPASGDPSLGADQVSECWDSLCLDVERKVGQLRQMGLTNDEELEAVTSDVRYGHTNESDAALAQRHFTVMADTERLRRLENCIAAIRTAALEMYSELQMPHVDYLHRAPYESLYVDRRLALRDTNAGSVPLFKVDQWCTESPERLVLLGVREQASPPL